MSGYGGGRGQGRGSGGYGGSGYGDEDYGDEAGQQPGYPQSGDDSYWQQGQAGGWAGGAGGWPEDSSAQGAGYGQPQGGRGQGYNWPDPRSAQGQDPRQRPGDAAPQFTPRSGPQPTQRGTGQGQQAPRGYDPRSGYQAAGRGDTRYGQGGQGGQGGPGPQPGWNPDQRGDSFVPGFGRRDEFDGRGPGRARGGAQYPGQQGGYDDYDGGRRGRDGWDDGGRRRRGPIRRLAPWIALVIILTPLVIGALYVYHLYENKTHPADYSGPGVGPTLTVEVKNGDTAFTLGPRLAALGVVGSARAFELAAEASQNTTALEPGYFKMKHHMQASLAWAALLNPKNRVQLTVLIPEGLRASQIIAKLAKATSTPVADFQKLITNPAGLGLPSYAKGKVEGYLFPATYIITPGETPLQILQAMVQRFNVEAQQEHLANSKALVGLTPEQVIIEASLAQAEGGSISDYPKIVRVIINRISIGMHLQFDSTVLYGLGKYAISATIPQTHIPGPYNTYLNAGLPIGPIDNPGDAAIHAVLHPATGDWLYFLTKPGGKSEFSHTPLTGQ